MRKDYVLIKLRGMFYEVKDEDSVILSYILNYKIRNGRVGFPINAMNKVSVYLEKYQISYEIVGKTAIKFSMIRNHYWKIYHEAINYQMKNRRLKELLLKLEEKTDEELDNLLKVTK